MKKGTIANINLIYILGVAAPVLILLLFYFRFSKTAPFQILVVFTIMYLIMAAVYHIKDKTLTFEIMIEYILIAALSLIILQGLLVQV